jgi:hypothetical protein
MPLVPTRKPGEYPGDEQRITLLLIAALTRHTISVGVPDYAVKLFVCNLTVFAFPALCQRCNFDMAYAALIKKRANVESVLVVAPCLATFGSGKLPIVPRVEVPIAFV